jgi:hypothetical protein
MPPPPLMALLALKEQFKKWKSDVVTTAPPTLAAEFCSNIVSEI